MCKEPNHVDVQMSLWTTVPLTKRLQHEHKQERRTEKKKILIKNLFSLVKTV